jgi:cytochrome c oxidase cbb3-type subunit I/II
MEVQTFYYDNKIVKQFVYATIFWGIVAFIVGLYIALELAFPALNFGIEYITFGRLRPVHTNAAIFAFVGNGIFAGAYYSMQRLLKTRMYSDFLSKINMWGWQLIIALAAVSLAMGISTSKEYAELEWPIDILIAIVWIGFGWNMFGTIARRRVKHIYVAIWFYIASFIAVALLHVVNSLELPVSFLKSYSVFAGVQDALVQWWYGHNAVAFYLTTPYLGVMYYFLPKAANRPVYSYKLSIIHFWTLIFIYIWAGPHHLLYNALPDWAQSLGVVFSIMLIAPSWGGMLNGLLTLRGVWDKVREDAILKFMAVAVTAYGMSTLEGPMLSIKAVNALGHFTDWIIAHVHIGALGWNGFLTFGMLYWLVPKIFNTNLYSNKLANFHFWIGTLGILLYAVPLYWGAFTQTLMWKEFNQDGFLAYPNFMETVTEIIPMYITRAVGGTLYLVGALIMLYNLIKTIQVGYIVNNEESSAPALEKMDAKRQSGERAHSWLERRPVEFYVLTGLAVLIGGLLEIVPLIAIKSNVPTIESVKPYTPLELQGRDVYIAEGCNNCHSQQVRPFRSETERYGDYSKSGEFVYDHPFLWGSRRTGPDLARTGVVGGKMYKSAAWHFKHMNQPKDVNEESVMPAYPWLLEKDIDTTMTAAKVKAMTRLGVPYSDEEYRNANFNFMLQANKIVDDLKIAGIETLPTKHIVALIAYLHRLGKDLYESNETEIKAQEELVIPQALNTSQDMAEAKEVFSKNCAACHGLSGEGNAIGPNLTDKFWLHGGGFADVYKSVYVGIPQNGMLSYKGLISDKQIIQVSSFVLSLQGTNPANAKAPQGKELTEN